MIKSLRIEMFNPGKVEADLKVAVPLPMISLAGQILPVRVKLFLDNAGIDICVVGEMPAAREWTGELIRIENSDGKMAISIENDA